MRTTAATTGEVCFRKTVVKERLLGPNDKLTLADLYHGETDGDCVVMTEPATEDVPGRESWLVFNHETGEVFWKQQDGVDRRRGVARYQRVTDRQVLLCLTSQLFVPLELRAFVCQYCPRHRQCSAGGAELFHVPDRVADRYGLPESDDHLWQRGRRTPAKHRAVQPKKGQARA